MEKLQNLGKLYHPLDSAGSERLGDNNHPGETDRTTGINQNLPHIRNIRAGINKYDPVHVAVFEVAFAFPEAIHATDEDIAILTEQVTQVQGLNVLQKTSGAGSQTFLGATVSFLEPTLDSTSAELTITFNLNLREETDNYVLKNFKKWANLGYDITTGIRTLKSDYCAEWLQICVANRNGAVWRKVIFYDVMLTNIGGLEQLDYTNREAATITVTFRSDFWDDALA